MKGAGMSERGCLLFLALCYLTGAAVVSMLQVGRSNLRPVEAID
jgi:hypothetical protein